MAGKKKSKRAKAHLALLQMCRAALRGSMPSTPVCMAQTAAQQQGGRCNATGTASGNTASTGPPIPVDAAADALAQVRIADGKDGSAGCGAVQQQQQQVRHGIQAQMADASAATDRQHSRATSAAALAAAPVLALMNNSNSSYVSELVSSLKGISDLIASSPGLCPTQLVAEVIPAMLRRMQSNSQAVQDQAVELSPVYRTALHAAYLCLGTEAAAAEGVIPQLVSLLRSPNQGIQSEALAWLGLLSISDSRLRQGIAAAGAIPALMEVLQKGSYEARLAAAWVLMPLSEVSGIDNGAALTTLISAAVSLLECGSPDEQAHAARCLWGLACHYQQVCLSVASQGVIPALVPLVHSKDPQAQQPAAGLLSAVVRSGSAADTAIAEDIIPSAVLLLASSDELTRFLAADMLQDILMRAINMPNTAAAAAAAAAGTVPCFVRMLASSTSDSHQAYNSSGTYEERRQQLTTFLPASKASISQHDWQVVAARSLFALAATGDTQCRAAIAAAGAITALSAAVTSQVEEVRQLASDAFKHLTEDPTNQAVVAAQLTSLLQNSRRANVQTHAVTAAGQLSVEVTTGASFRSAFLAAGGAAAVVSLLGATIHKRVANSPHVAAWALYALQSFTQDASHAAAIVEAGVIPLLVQLLLPSPDEPTHHDAALVLCSLALHTDLHDQLAEVIPQLLDTMHSDDAQVQWAAGRTLQLLARAATPIVLCVFDTTEPQWQSLLHPACSVAQLAAGGAVNLSLPDVEWYDCEKLKATLPLYGVGIDLTKSGTDCVELLPYEAPATKAMS